MNTFVLLLFGPSSFNRYRAFLTGVLCLLTCGVFYLVPARGDESGGRQSQSARPGEAKTATGHSLSEEEELAATRISLSLRAVPLHEALDFLAATHKLRFVYGAVPDATISATLEDAPLLPVLAAVLEQTGFQMHRAGRTIWVLRRQGAALVPPLGVYSIKIPAGSRAATPHSPATSEKIRGGSWEIWTRSFAPPAGWILPETAQGRVGVQFGPQTRSTAGWRFTPLRLPVVTSPQTVNPFIAVLRPPATGQTAYARWTMSLRTLPRGMHLLLELPAEATLYVNGALLFRRRKGLQRIDLSHLLRLGNNCVALQLEEEEPPERAKKPAILFRYIWLLPGQTIVVPSGN